MTATRSRVMGGTLVVVGALALVGGLWMLWPPVAVAMAGLAALIVGVMLVVEVD